MRHEKKKFWSATNMMTVFIVLIMTLSVLGIWMEGDTGETKKYGKYKLVQVNNQWVTRINEKEFAFYYLPEEVKKLSIEQTVIDRINNIYEIDSTSNISDRYAQDIALIQYDVGRALEIQNVYQIRGFSSENEYNITVLDCRDASVSVPVMKIETSNDTKIWMDGNCIMVNAASSNEFMMIKDRLVYEILGIGQ